MNDYFEFHNPVKILAGYKALDNIAQELEYLGARRPMILADKGIEAAGLLGTLTEAFAESGMTIGAVFTDVPADSSTKTVGEAASVYRGKDCDAIVAIGGGSVIDTAKGVNILVSLGGDDLSAYAGAGSIDRKLRPFVVIPTTAGTGSEVTLVAVIKDERRERKLLFVSPRILPDAAIIDPRMTLSLPPSISAATGIDALSHAVEAFTCLGKNPVSDAYAVTAIETIMKHLVAVVRKPDDAAGRLAMAVAATCAGIAFSNSMVGLVHSLGHATGAIAHVPHGIAMNIFMPHVLRYNLAKNSGLTAALLLPLAGSEAFSRCPVADRAALAIKTIEGLQEELWDLTKLPRRLEETGKVKKSDFSSIAKAAVDDASISYNPTEADLQDCMALLESAW